MAQLNTWLSNQRLEPIERLRKQYPVSQSSLNKALLALGTRTAETDPEQLKAELLRVAQENHTPQR